MTPVNENIKIVPFNDKHAKEFKQINLEWLEYYSLLEVTDLIYLDNPQQTIIDKGGLIMVAVLGSTVVGTCAIIKESEGMAELAKLAVSTKVRGNGIGKILTIECIRQAQEKGYKKITLVSNKKLNTAIKLYESLGFQHAPIPEDIEYATADVFMVLEYEN